jgi:hypothetical protein
MNSPGSGDSGMGRNEVLLLFLTDKPFLIWVFTHSCGFLLTVPKG